MDKKHQEIFVVLSVQGCLPYINLETDEDGKTITFESETEAKAYAQKNCAWDCRIVKW